ncbi:MAG: acyltransferase [Clostridia bacterium]|nr:acyltransferase [Clostridia bacterium]
MSDLLFTKAYEGMDAEARESFYRTVFMNDPSPYAAEVRLAYYKSVLKFMGEGVRIGCNVKIVNPQWVSLGDNVRLSDDVTIIARGPEGVTLEEGVALQERVYLDTERPEGGYIRIGHHAYIGTGTTLFGHKGLEIGDHTLLAQNITITPYSHKFPDPEKDIITQGGNCKKVTIGRDVYIGMGCNVMYSGDIGDGSVIGCGSVVVKPIPPYSVAVGTPAKVIKKREKTE